MMNKKFVKIVAKATKVLMVAAVLAGVTVNAGNAFAKDSYSGSGGNGTRKTTNDQHTAYNKQWGATWVFYTWQDNPYKTRSSQASGNPGAILNDTDLQMIIPGEGMTSDAWATVYAHCLKFEGFYALVNVEYDKDKNAITGKPLGTKQLRDLSVPSMGLYGGTTYRGDKSWFTTPLHNTAVSKSWGNTNNKPQSSAKITDYGIPIEEVYQAFRDLPDADRLGQTWDGNSTLGWFCGGKSEEPNEHHVQSTSEVSYGSSSRETPRDGTDTWEVTETEVTNYTVVFRHNLYVDTEEKPNIKNAKVTWETAGYHHSSNSPPSGTTKLLSSTGWEKQVDGTWKTTVSVSANISVPQDETGEWQYCQKITHDYSTFWLEDKTVKKRGSASSRICITIKRKRQFDFPQNNCLGFGGYSSTTIDHGNTLGTAWADNLNDSATWSKNVFARPGDTIKFCHHYSFGVMAVRKSDTYGGSRVFPVNETALSDAMPDTWYSITSNYDNNYALGRYRDLGYIGDRVTIDRIYAGFSGGAAYTNGEKIRGDYNSDYNLVLTSPSDRGVDTTRYKCNLYDFTQFVENGFQLPGVLNGAPCAASNASGSTNTAGRIISQTISYPYQTGWVHERHWSTGSCTCGQNSTGDMTYYNEQNLSYPGGNGSITNTYPPTFDFDPITFRPIYRPGGDYGYRDSFNNCDTTSCEDQPCSDCSYTDANGNPVPKTCCTPYSGYKTKSTATRHPVHFNTGGTRSDTAYVHVPYNFDTAVSSTLYGGDTIYAGENVSSFFTATIKGRINSSVLSTSKSYATVYPSRLEGGDLRIEQFVLSPGASSAAVNTTGLYNIGNGRMCDIFGGALINCQSVGGLNQDANWLNQQGRYKGWTWSQGFTFNVPNDVPIGSKYCVAIGFTIADSHSVPGATVVSGDNRLNSQWRVSYSCRTIAKKPNFQAWGANLFAESGISTSWSTKNDDATLGSTYSANKMFGSWEEYLVISNEAVSKFGSGASMGYDGSNLSLVGGHSVTGNFCDLSRMTISNNNCSFVGNARIGLSNATLSRLFARYRPSSMTMNNPGSVVDVANARPLSTTVGASGATGVYVGTAGDASINSTIVRGANTPTLVIFVPGKLTINANICDGYGTCTGYDNSLVLRNRNSQTFSNIASLPQVIIIAQDIDINANVTQIDAWLIALGSNVSGRVGQVNTCAGFTLGVHGSGDCNKTLIVNGPTITNSLLLNRTAGAYTRAHGSFGANNADGGSNDLSDDGSITPAEIFNYRPDALLWAYSQAQDYSQATVTYTRELAPRY